MEEHPRLVASFGRTTWTAMVGPPNARAKALPAATIHYRLANAYHRTKVQISNEYIPRSGLPRNYCFAVALKYDTNLHTPTLLTVVVPRLDALKYAMLH